MTALGVEAIIALSTAALACFAAAGATLLRQVVGSRRRQRDERSRNAWSDRWIDIVFGDTPRPSGPLEAAAADALLDLRDSLKGEPAATVDSLVRAYGIDTALVGRLEVHSRKSRFEVLDGLGRARSTRAVPKLILVANDPEPEVRGAGIRALVRSVAAITSKQERQDVAPEVVRALHTAELSPAGLGEAMELLGPASTAVVSIVLADPKRWGNRMVVAALETVGRLRLDGSVHHAVAFASSRTAPVRVSALHALSRFERLPASAPPVVLKAFGDRDNSTRIEAARAARLIQPKTAIPALEELLVDRDWMVRRVAATTLAVLGGPGIRTLIATSLVHGDHRARNVATQVLVESRSAAELYQEPEKVG